MHSHQPKGNALEGSLVSHMQCPVEALCKLTIFSRTLLKNKRLGALGCSPTLMSVQVRIATTVLSNHDRQYFKSQVQVSRKKASFSFPLLPSPTSQFKVDLMT